MGVSVAQGEGDFHITRTGGVLEPVLCRIFFGPIPWMLRSRSHCGPYEVKQVLKSLSYSKSYDEFRVLYIRGFPLPRISGSSIVPGRG